MLKLTKAVLKSQPVLHSVYLYLICIHCAIFTHLRSDRCVFIWPRECWTAWTKNTQGMTLFLVLSNWNFLKCLPDLPLGWHCLSLILLCIIIGRIKYPPSTTMRECYASLFCKILSWLLLKIATFEKNSSVTQKLNIELALILQMSDREVNLSDQHLQIKVLDKITLQYE